MNDVIINKSQSIQHCIERAREEYTAADNEFNEDYTRQDAAVLNVLRACEQTIDLANHIIKIHKFGIPTDSAESFALLTKKSIITVGLSRKLIRMVGFRNIAVHEYQDLNLEVLRYVITDGYRDLIAYCKELGVVIIVE